MSAFEQERPDAERKCSVDVVLPVVGEEQYTRQPPAELLNNFLYYIARAGSSGERISALRARFGLTELLPGNQQVEVVPDHDQILARHAELLDHRVDRRA